MPRALILASALGFSALVGGCRGCEREAPPPAPKVHGSAAAEPAGAENAPPAAKGSTTTSTGPTIGAATGGGPVKTDEEMCVDRLLVEQKLNAYGDPEGTMYAGGTPLFDERTGTRRERLPFLYEKRPELKEKCAAARK